MNYIEESQGRQEFRALKDLLNLLNIDTSSVRIEEVGNLLCFESEEIKGEANVPSYSARKGGMRGGSKFIDFHWAGARNDRGLRLPLMVNYDVGGLIDDSDLDRLKQYT